MEFSIMKCIELAHKVEGEMGQVILDLASEIEDLREQVAFPKHPNLIGSYRVSEILEIDRRNLHHKRKVKEFPNPVLVIESGPLWDEETIRSFKEESEDRRRKKRKEFDD